MITEKDNVFYCDCGFSFQRGRSGAHDCADGLRNKLAESEARCAALAAENAGLKSKAAELVHEASEVYSAYNSTITEPDGDFMDMQTLQEMQCVETPATDAFLAEVRAQGVERLANAWYAIANETDPGISISDSSRLKYRQRADDAADFANEIRQEAAQ